MYFVTGGTGLLGNAIVRRLSSEGETSAVLVRQPDPPDVFDDLDIEQVVGDLDDTDAMDAAIARSDGVFHSAGLIHIGFSRREESMRINRDGAAAVADLCLKYDKPMVHIGSVNATAIGTIDQPSNETMPFEANGGQVDSSYVASKKAGVDAVLERVDRGLRCVVIQPGFMLGPYDWKPSSGRMMVEVQKAWRPLCPSGGCSVCDVRDVADGCVAAMRKLISGEIPSGRQYNLAGHNWTYFRLWTEMARRGDRRGPLKPMGVVPKTIGRAIGGVRSMIGLPENDINSAGIAMSSQYHWHDSQRAIDELGYRIRPAAETLDDAHRWITQHHATS